MRAAPDAASRVRIGARGHWDGAEVARAWSSSVLMDPDGLSDVLQQNLSSHGCLRVEPSLGNTGADELTGVGWGSRDGAEQAAANEKQTESPDLPPHPQPCLTSPGQHVFS